jgi:hypothetical protein
MGGRQRASPARSVRPAEDNKDGNRLIAADPKERLAQLAALGAQVQGGRKAVGAKRASCARDPVGGAARRRGRAAGERGNVRVGEVSMRLGIPFGSHSATQTSFHVR